jgi:hypothetical protein
MAQEAEEVDRMLRRLRIEAQASRGPAPKVFEMALACKARRLARVLPSVTARA